jgi:hypothetical protein
MEKKKSKIVAAIDACAMWYVVLFFAIFLIPVLMYYTQEDSEYYGPEYE